MAAALSGRKQMSLNGSRILLVGLAYKRNVDDLRESPALTIFKQLEHKGAAVDYYDPWVPVIPETREFPHLAGRRSVAWKPEFFGDDLSARSERKYRGDPYNPKRAEGEDLVTIRQDAGGRL